MSLKRSTLIGLMGAVVLLGAMLPAAADEALDNAFNALKTYDWGDDRAVLKPIDDAVVATYGDAQARKELEKRLAAVLGTDASRAAKDFVCRKLSIIGTADSVPALAPLLLDEKLSHMARYALERMSCEASLQAMRDALPKAKGLVKVGIINSLGVRGDAKSVPALVGLLGDSDKQVVASAAAALGSIATPEAARALQDFQKKAPEGLEIAAADACLICAEKLLAAGKKAEAQAIYKQLSTSTIKHVRVAAMRGLLSTAGAK